MGDLGFSELLVIAIIAIVIYGKDLPQAARKMASIYSRFRRHLTDIKDEFQRQIPAEDLSLDRVMDPYRPPEGAYDPAQPPPVPTDVRAYSDHTQAFLNWETLATSVRHSVKRSTTSGGSYETIAADLQDCYYSDTGLSDGTTYYYVVSTTNDTGESANSTEVSVSIVSKTREADVPPEPGTTPAPAPAPEPPAP